MNREEFINYFSSALEAEYEVNFADKLCDIKKYDSTAVLMLVMQAEERFGIIFDYTDVIKCKTVEDIFIALNAK